MLSGENDSERIVSTAGWLGENVTYYNLLCSKFGKSIWDAVDFENLEVDLDGLADYLRFGYSVFGQTPIKGVKFLRPNEKLIDTGNGQLRVEPSGNDPVDKWITKRTTPDEALERFYDWEFKSIENSDIVLPLSAGLDSRFLLLYLKRKKMSFWTYTYGTSRNQADSSEIFGAELIAQRANVPWTAIALETYHNEIDNWYDHFGPAMHLHGMYQIEFYKQILSRHRKVNVLSGIVGDAWAGSLVLSTPLRPSDLQNFGLARGLRVPDAAFKNISGYGNSEMEFSGVREKLREPLHQIVYLVRTKLLLLSYLLEVPRQLGAFADSPFLDETVALSFSTLDSESRNNRQWQKDHLKLMNFEIQDFGNSNQDFSMDYGQLQTHPLQRIDPKLLSRYVSPLYIERINRKIGGISMRDRMWLKMREQNRFWPTIGNHIRDSETMNAYAGYMCLKPIEQLLNLIEYGVFHKKEGRKHV